MFSIANLFGSILFGSIGMGGVSYGRKAGAFGPIIFGIALMVFPYFVSQAWLLYGVGIALTGMMIYWRDR